MAMPRSVGRSSVTSRSSMKILPSVAPSSTAVSPRNLEFLQTKGPTKMVNEQSATTMADPTSFLMFRYSTTAVGSFLGKVLVGEI